MSLKDELQGIISGNGSVRNGKNIQAITDYLRREKEAIRGIEKTKLNKEQETQILRAFIESTNLWYKDIDPTKYIGKGQNRKFTNFAIQNLF